MSAPTLPRTDLGRSVLADAFYMLGDCAGSGRLQVRDGALHITATDQEMADDIVAAMTQVAQVRDPDRPGTVWSGWLLRQPAYVRVAPDAPFDPAEAVADLAPALVGGTP